MKLILIVLLLISNITLSKEFDTTPQVIESIGIPKGYMSATYDNRYGFSVPQEYEIDRDKFGIEFLVALLNGKAVFTLGQIKHNTIYKPEAYGLKDYSTRQLLSALYDNNHTSNKLVNESRKHLFDTVDNIAVYKRDGLLFFREDGTHLPETDLPKSNIPPIKTTFVISSPVNDEVFTLNFLVEDEDVKMNFIKSFKPL